LILALDRLRQAKPDLRWKLLLVGSGPEQARLEAAVQRLALGNRILFAGHRSNVLPFLQLSNLMVLPSHSEGSPHVVLEAMAAGVPIVATRVGGVPEILEDAETAVLVPPRDPAALASGIARVLASETMAASLAANAREVLRRRFSHDTYKTTLLGIYDEVLRR
jgi:glycosyltransferase involved in cell wall biosynthesis